MRSQRKPKKRTRDKKARSERHGGIAFFVSLGALIFLSLFNFFLLPELWDSLVIAPLIRFGIGVFIGVWLAQGFLKGRFSVAIHEFKHRLISGLVGNKHKGFVVKKNSGEYRYEYTKETAQYNAFIALAPYWVPLFTGIALLLSLTLWRHNHTLIPLVVGVAYGVDLLMNTRDISPHQTDLTLTRGGYQVGVLYVIVMNATIFSYLISWVMQRLYGLKYLGYGLWQFVLHIVSYYREAAGF